MEFKKEHWIRSKIDNENLILNNSIQIEMAKEVIKLCDRKIAEFPKDPPKPQKKIPTGVN